MHLDQGPLHRRPRLRVVRPRLPLHVLHGARAALAPGHHLPTRRTSGDGREDPRARLGRCRRARTHCTRRWQGHSSSLTAPARPRARTPRARLRGGPAAELLQDRVRGLVGRGLLLPHHRYLDGSRASRPRSRRWLRSPGLDRPRKWSKEAEYSPASNQTTSVRDTVKMGRSRAISRAQERFRTPNLSCM